MSVFGESKRFEEAVQRVNAVAVDKLPLLLARIMRKLAAGERRLFTGDEMEQLAGALQMPSASTRAVVDACVYVFQQSAFVGVSGDKFVQQLRGVGVGADASAAFAAVWAEHGPKYVQALRAFQLAPQQLDAVHWALDLKITDSTHASDLKPRATLTCDLRADDDTTTTVPLHMDHQSLRYLFDQLEHAQQQLDALK